MRFLGKNQHAIKKNFKKKNPTRIPEMSLCQKLGIILESESKVVQKLSLEKNVFDKKWSPKLIFLDETLC